MPQTYIRAGPEPGPTRHAPDPTPCRTPGPGAGTASGSRGTTGADQACIGNSLGCRASQASSGPSHGRPLGRECRVSQTRLGLTTRSRRLTDKVGVGESASTIEEEGQSGAFETHERPKSKGGQGIDGQWPRGRGKRPRSSDSARRPVPRPRPRPAARPAGPGRRRAPASPPPVRPRSVRPRPSPTAACAAWGRCGS